MTYWLMVGLADLRRDTPCPAGTPTEAGATDAPRRSRGFGHLLAVDRLPETPRPHGTRRQARFGLPTFCNPVLQCGDWAKPATQANFWVIVISPRGFQCERPAKPVLRALAAFLCVERGNFASNTGKTPLRGCNQAAGRGKKIEKDNKYRFVLSVICYNNVIVSDNVTKGDNTMALVNFEAVAAAAEALQIAGQRPSVRAVIAHLGGGSPNAVLKYLGEWKAGRPVVRIDDTALDARITSAIIDQMQRVAVAAAAAAEERAAGIEDDLQALAEAQQAAEQQIEALTTERDTSREQSEGLARQLADAQADAARSLQHSAEQAAALRADLASERKHQEKTAAALVKAEVRLEVLPDLQVEIARLRTALEAESKARTASEQQAAVLAAKLEAATERAVKAEAAAIEAAMQERKSRETAALESGKIEAMKTQIQQQIHDLDAARKEAKKASGTEEATALRGRSAAKPPKA